jgi:hypothetical protein
LSPAFDLLEFKGLFKIFERHALLVSFKIVIDYN